MRLRTQRKVIYAAMGLTVLALTSGFALASVSLGSAPVSSQQGARTTSVTPVTGLSSLGQANLTVVTAGMASTFSSCASEGGPCTVTDGAVATCVGGIAPYTNCASGDFVEQVNSTVTAHVAFTGTVEITMYVTAGGVTYAGTTEYYTDTAPTTAQTISQDFDIGSPASGPAAVSDVSVVAQVV